MTYWVKPMDSIFENNGQITNMKEQISVQFECVHVYTTNYCSLVEDVRIFRMLVK